MRKVLTCSLIVLLGCAASVPSWYNKMPKKRGYRYAAGTERGDEIQNAVDEATEIAVANLGRYMETESAGRSK